MIRRALGWLKVDDRIPLFLTLAALALAFILIFAPVPRWVAPMLLGLVLLLATGAAIDLILRPRERGRHSKPSPLTNWRKP